MGEHKLSVEAAEQLAGELLDAARRSEAPATLAMSPVQAFSGFD
jgi:hypothetical protein